MEWGEVDLEAAEWNIPGEKMKTVNPILFLWLINRLKS